MKDSGNVMKGTTSLVTRRF